MYVCYTSKRTILPQRINKFLSTFVLMFSSGNLFDDGSFNISNNETNTINN